MGHEPITFKSCGRLPHPDDNVAIATRTLRAGTEILLDEQQFSLDFTVLVGHRFAVKPIAASEFLLSWGLPFGIATEAIRAGQYVCNEGMVEALNGRTLDFDTPQSSNFQDRIVPYQIDEASFVPGVQIPLHREIRTFQGYQRGASRGVGTRNFIVILGTTSSTAAYARTLTDSLREAAEPYANIDGIVPIAHTEGSGYEEINNLEFLLRTLAGLMVHPNVAAVLAVDLESDPVNNRLLERFLLDNGYPLDDVAHQFMTLSGNWQADQEIGRRIVHEWLPAADIHKRTPQSLAHLSVALQCGGSDAFSGISGNPLASTIAREIIRYGGRANLAETDELIGSESYVLQNVRDLKTANTFLDYVARFKERLAWHGQTAEGNPSGGNRYRGLYNIALKSIGAAMKRHPDVRLDNVVDYGERMIEPGFYFMNTPGNDLESIAGQVAGGSNLIIFVTGNGSITNFPFAPTIKVMTTTRRYELLPEEMDINAGTHLDGLSMEDLTQKSLELLIDIASGRPSRGELAGHSQISIWRNWQQRDRSRLPLILNRDRPSGKPNLLSETGFALNEQDRQLAETLVAQPISAQTRLILPTSLCSGQIAGLAVTKLNEQDLPNGSRRRPFATLVHTEGCGVAFKSTQEVYAQTMIGYATHPLVADCLFLEHGCEKAHNDYLKALIREAGRSTDEFGWASVQMDGGIARVIAGIETYFTAQAANTDAGPARSTFNLAIVSEGEVPTGVATSFARLTRQLVHAGGTLVMPGNGGFAQSPEFWAELNMDGAPAPTLAYGQATRMAGLHIMERPTPHWTETITGLGATGAQVIVGYTDKPRAGHPFVPVLLVAAGQTQHDADLRLEGAAATWPSQILESVAAVNSGEMEPKTVAGSHTDFQLTRGWLGIST